VQKIQNLFGKKKTREKPKSISSILDNCIAIEKYPQKKYKELLNQTDNERAKEFLTGYRWRENPTH
jgi:hypothetical protein